MPTYTYGMKGAPRVGNGLGGLPKKAASSSSLSTVLFFDSGSGDFKIPSGFSKVRITAVGPGGNGSGTGGGGGGGLSATNILSIQGGELVSYIVGTPGLDSKVSFKGYNLVGGAGGFANASVAGAPGVGSGGDINFSGGSGGSGNTFRAGGGGAAGLGSNGGDGGNGNAAGSAPAIDNGPLAGGGGGGGANSTAAGTFAGSGGGSGGNGGMGFPGLAGGQVFPSRMNIGYSAYYSSTSGPVSGFPGGGGGATNVPGANGCVRIELWP